MNKEHGIYPSEVVVASAKLGVGKTILEPSTKSNISLNDNQRKGLPADIDLLASAITLLQNKPDDLRRVTHLREVLERVTPQVVAKENELAASQANQQELS